mmetsp:Transcript_8942/g.17882  ORF Transcript_8942/g.17882 Transcript_8942/m.17882 type:complete len:210 (+) Transcript_8942:758-1387(+)
MVWVEPRLELLEPRVVGAPARVAPVGLDHAVVVVAHAGHVVGDELTDLVRAFLVVGRHHPDRLPHRRVHRGRVWSNVLDLPAKEVVDRPDLAAQRQLQQQGMHLIGPVLNHVLRPQPRVDAVAHPRVRVPRRIRRRRHSRHVRAPLVGVPARKGLDGGRRRQGPVHACDPLALVEGGFVPRVKGVDKSRLGVLFASREDQKPSCRVEEA